MNADSLLPLRHAIAQRFATETRQADGGLEIHRRRVRGRAAMRCLAVLVLSLSLAVQAQPFNAATYNHASIWRATAPTPGHTGVTRCVP
jgi:hypothetical protein